MELYPLPYLKNPHWSDRNKIIADMMGPNKSVIDLGCGAKILLNYYTPLKYLGVDGIPSADLVVDLDSEFQLPGGRDYAVNSGILEFVLRPDLYLEKIKNISHEYIFSWWRGQGWGRMSFDELEKLLSKNYQIIDARDMGLVNRIYKCRSYSVQE